MRYLGLVSHKGGYIKLEAWKRQASARHGKDRRHCTNRNTERNSTDNGGTTVVPNLGWVINNCLLRFVTLFYMLLTAFINVTALIR